MPGKKTKVALINEKLAPWEQLFDPEVGDREEEMEELLEKIDRVPGFAIAFLLDDSSDFWNDDYVDPEKADLWEHFAKYVLQDARKKAQASDQSGGDLGMVGGLVGGAGGQSANTAEVHLQKGREHYDKKQFADAIECFKKASNWYFKAGDRKLSDMCRNQARRARAALTEEEVSTVVESPGQCYCVCEWRRVCTIYSAVTKRLATALQSWSARRETELSFKKGDIIRVIERAEDEMKDGFSAEQPFTWYWGQLNDDCGLFPTTQLMYKPSGKPVLNDDNVHVFRNVCSLDATPLFVTYSAGQSSGSDGSLPDDVSKYLKPQLPEEQEDERARTPGLSTRPNTVDARSRAQTAQSNGFSDRQKHKNASETLDEDDEEQQTGQIGSALRSMDLEEFVRMLIDLQLACPEGSNPTSFQITRDQALTAFRTANRGEAGDDDTSQLDFEEFLEAMLQIKKFLNIPDTFDQIENNVRPGQWACSFGLRALQGAIDKLNTAVKLISSVDDDWAKLLTLKTEKAVLCFGDFQEAHARQLTIDMKYEWAYENYEHARKLFSGVTGHDLTQFKPHHDKLIQLKRGFVVNQYKNAMQLMKLTAPNVSSHAGIPAHIGDPNKPQELIEKAKNIYQELDDHIAMAVTLQAGAEHALRTGDLEKAIPQAQECQNQYSRLSDQQGLAASFRLLGTLQAVNGQVLAAVGSLQASLQISADNSDVANELASHEVLGCIQLWLSNIDRAEAHYAQCLRLAKTSHQIEILGKATAGLGYCALTRGNFNASLEHLHAALSMLRSCNERQEASRVVFEIASIQRSRAQAGWQQRMEDAATLLTRTIPTLASQGHTLFIARAKAQVWIWRTVSRCAIELRERMQQGESLVDTMGQLSWEALQEGKSVLTGVEQTGDKLIQAEVLLNTVNMLMLGLQDGPTVLATIKDAQKIFEENSCQRQIAVCETLKARVKIFHSDYKAARTLLESANLRLAQASCTAGRDQVEGWWFLAIALRLAGDEEQGRAVLAKAIELLAEDGGARLCSLCSIHIHGACYTCLECYQRDYCKDCYAECALNGRSCHRTSSMIRAARPM